MSRITGGNTGRESGPGRPRVSSREVLEEAAFELFLEQGYEGTTVAQIARRAGVSRGTFFNYFPTKADVFWADVDEALDELPGLLRGAPPPDDEGGARSAMRTALLALGRGFGPQRVPWLIPHFEIIGRPAEVGASALVRMSRAAGILREFLVERSPSSRRNANSRTQAYVVVAAIIAAAYAWSEAGPRRGALDAHLAGALAVATGPDSDGPAVSTP